MGTSRNGRCEVMRCGHARIFRVSLQWGPPGMGGVRWEVSLSVRCVELSLQWGPPGMGGVRQHSIAHADGLQSLQWGPPGMGGVSPAAHHRATDAATELQWGPPGMGGVRGTWASSHSPDVSSLQWGPPGMGGVSRHPDRRWIVRPRTSMGTSRNGRCEHSRRSPAVPG